MTSSTTTLSTSAPQSCVLGPLLFTLLTHDSAPAEKSNHCVKFMDDTNVAGLTSNNNGSSYRHEVDLLTMWCRDNLTLNVDKTKEIVVDFRRSHTQHLCKLRSDTAPTPIMCSSYRGVVESVFTIYTYNTRLARKATNIVCDPTHPSSSAFSHQGEGIGPSQPALPD